ncbi:hypothetical protein ACLMJK_004012 [Lecanora helva]
MYKAFISLLALVASSVAWTVPVEYVEERHIVNINKRQADVSQLLQLGSLAGITALPTDPAVLLQLGPLANSLASALPTPSVLSVLLTAAPSGFVSSIVNDQSYANSFESAFSAGSSPSWFNGLPTNVKSYLHTYSGFGGLATAAGAVKNVATVASSDVSRASKMTGSAASEASSASGVSTTSGGSATSMAMGSSASETNLSSASAASSAGMDATSVASSESNTASTAASAATGSSSSAQAGAAHPTGSIFASLAGAVGVLGAALAL